MNWVILTGRLTKDVECKYTQSQMAVARFNLALDRGKDKDGNSRGADFPTCVVFGRTAENLEKYVSKGCRITVEGEIRTGSYEKNGNKYYTTEVFCSKVEFIDFKGRAAEPEEDPSEYEGFAQLDESIPF